MPYANVLKKLPGFCLLVSLASCATVRPAPTVPTATVVKYLGSTQCQGGGLTLAQVQDQLTAAGVPVVRMACGHDGRVHPAVCGAGDGRLAIAVIPAAQLTRATDMGFLPVAKLPDHGETPCK
jgi:hypothetical protein